MMERKNLRLAFGVIILALALFSAMAFVASERSGGRFSGSHYSGGYSALGNYYWQYNRPSFPQLYSSGDIENFWPILNDIKNDQCNATTDFIVGIPPGGCSPAVVRSDLLAEQNVPVFCQLYAIKVNPLIDVSSIRTISFRGEYPKEVAGVSFYPARAAARSYYSTLLSSPVVNNIGYVVIILKREADERKLKDWIEGNLTATLRYDAGEAYGVGRSEFYLAMDDNKESQSSSEYPFWEGRGKIKLLGIGKDGAKIGIYSGDNLIRQVFLREGQTSGYIYFPGYYCWAGMRVRLNRFVGPADSAEINVDGERLWVRDGTRILNGKCVVRNILADSNGTGSLKISCPRDTIYLRIENASEVLIDSEDNNYFEGSTKAVKELLDLYPSVLKPLGKQTYAEDALYKQIGVAHKIGNFKTELELINKFLDEYPNSPVVEDVRKRKDDLLNYDYSEAFDNVYVTNKLHSISVLHFKNHEEGKESVDLVINGETFSNKKPGDELDVREGKITVGKILPKEVEVLYKKDRKKRSETIWIKDGEDVEIGGSVVRVRNIDVEEFAYVSIIPNVKWTNSKADFKFKIGVEKRAIKLSPEKTKEMLGNINESIKKWEGISNRLGNLVKAWKGACFATSSVLMIKNMVSGFSGETLARQKVMKKYKAICDQDYPEMTRTQCYNELSKDIEKDVEDMKGALNEVNDALESAAESNIGSEGLFGQKKIVNQTKYIQSLRRLFGKDKIKVNIKEGEVTLNPDDLNTVSQIKAALLVKKLNESGLGENSVAYQSAKQEMDDALRNIALSKKQEEAAKKSIGSFGDGISAKDIDVLTTRKTERRTWSGKYGRDFGLSEEDSGKKVQPVVSLSGGTPYLFVLGDVGRGGVSAVEKVYKKGDNGGWVESNDEDIKKESRKYVYYTAESKGRCSNRWDRGNAKISFYESGKNKGLPGIVPFDLEKGWYAMVPNSGGTFLEDTPKGYSASLEARYFKICNIGSDGIMSPEGGDLCQTFDINTVGSVDKFLPCPSMRPEEVSDLFLKAQQAIREALLCGESKTKSCRILRERFEVGAPMSSTTGLECQDFMSPEDCKIMFNACDPVICPVSRCNLGGLMNVNSVIQSGIIGSIALCLPNSAEGVAVPVCLTGIHAGIDSFTSILKAEQDCLKQNLETGEHVGICDEITSVYKCEFFWRQLSPLMDILVPRTIESIYNGGFSRVRGGGEYLLVQNAWDSLQKNIDFFRNTYAEDTFRAFNLRNSEEAGGKLCKSFVGTSLPASAESLNTLLEPDSPPQFYAWFSENLFTDATIPQTSSYKVYFHIYAGKDRGVQFRVYLKDPPASNYYRANPTIQVKLGYVPKGSYADETVDFTAPSGYKTLCVVIDDQEECGFKQVSSDFGLDYVSNKYVEEQASKEDITTEKECISGTPSVLSLANPNLEAGASEIAQPENALRGIVRVCATENPGAGVSSAKGVHCKDNSDCGEKSARCDLKEGSPNKGFCVDGAGRRIVRYYRWKDVGYCGDVNTRCWLDVSSVKNDLEKVSAIEGNATSISILEEQAGLIKSTERDLESVRKEISSLREDIRNAKKEDVEGLVKRLDRIIGTDELQGEGTDKDRAEALALKAELYNKFLHAKIKETASRQEPAPRPSEEEKGSEVESRPLDENGLADLMSSRNDCDCNYNSKNKCKDYAKAILTYSSHEGIDPLLVLSVMIQESMCKYDARNGKSLGLMQIEPGTFGEVCNGKLSSGNSKFSGMDKLDNTEQNIECGVKILKKKYELYKNGLDSRIVRKVCEKPKFISKYSSYKGWNASLRGYNGWGCGEGVNTNYVEDVNKIFSSLKEDLQRIGEGDLSNSPQSA